MTFGSNINKAVRDTEDTDELEKEEQWVIWDWMNESYQLMCREYRQSLGLVNLQNYESKYETVSERKYWSELYRVRGYDGGIYEGKRDYDGQEIILEVIPDPPPEWQIEWTQKMNITLRPSPPETDGERKGRLQAWEDGIRI